jgi:hypothetical protein
VLACTGSLQAHHNGSMFDPAPIWVKGTVVRYEAVNPHATIVLEDPRADGQVQRWTIEGPHLGRIGQMGVQPKVGDAIEVCGFALRESVSLRSSSPDPYGLSEQFVHGKALVMPDGHMESFGPYGKLDHCIRPGDSIQIWLDLLDTYPRARADWCNGLNFSIQSTAPQAVVDEINRLMANPC